MNFQLKVFDNQSARDGQFKRCPVLFSYMIFLVAVATFLSTLLGGSFALWLKDRLHLILGFSAGAIIAVAFFDLIPESLRLAKGLYGPATVLSITALGFILYLTLDRLILLNNHAPGDADAKHKHRRGLAGAGSLSLHSFLDGIGIGFAFQVSTSVGIIVAVAVLAHDFSDGINTVNFIIKNNGSRSSAWRWLFIDALTPVAGVLVTLFFTLSAQSLSLLLSLFAGFFLYLGASDLIPESYHSHPTRFTTYATIFGVLFIYAVVKLASS